MRQHSHIHSPIVGIVVTISPNLSLYRIVVLPAASKPTINILISFLPKRPLNKFANTFPIASAVAFRGVESQISDLLASLVNWPAGIIFNKFKSELLQYRLKYANTGFVSLDRENLKKIPSKTEGYSRDLFRDIWISPSS